MYADSLNRLMQKIEREGTIAVFCLGKKIFSTTPDTERFAFSFRYRFDKLIGIYDKDCPREWLLEDLQWAEARL